LLELYEEHTLRQHLQSVIFYIFYSRSSNDNVLESLLHEGDNAVVSRCTEVGCSVTFTCSHRADV